MLEVLRSGQLSLGPLLAAFERAFAARVGARTRARSRPGRPVCTWRCARSGQRRRRGDDDAVLVRRERERRDLRARAPGLRRHRPGDAQPRPRGGCGRGHRADRGAAAGARVRLPGRHGGASRRSGCRSSRTPARRSARATPTAAPVGGRGHLAVFGFYANKQLTTGEGGVVTLRRAGDQGADRLRAQSGPRARHGLARPRPPRLQLPAVRHRLRARDRPARAARRDAGRPRARGGALPRGAAPRSRI